nr:hypothetical protein [Tanacetum cinerariifolium]
NQIAYTNQQQPHFDKDLVPTDDRVKIGMSNFILALEKKQKEPIYQLILGRLKFVRKGKEHLNTESSVPKVGGGRGKGIMSRKNVDADVQNQKKKDKEEEHHLHERHTSLIIDREEYLEAEMIRFSKKNPKGPGEGSIMIPDTHVDSDHEDSSESSLWSVGEGERDDEEVEVISDDERTKTDVSDTVRKEQAAKDQELIHKNVMKQPEVPPTVLVAPSKTTQSRKLKSPQSKAKKVIKKPMKPEKKVDAKVVLQRLMKLKKKFDAISKIDHTDAIEKSFKADVDAMSKKILMKVVPDFVKIKQEHV